MNIRNILISFLLLGSSLALFADPISPAFFEQVDALLKRHVESGVVDYPGIKQDASFHQLIDQIEAIDLDGAEGPSLKAFYINAYNLLVINQALEQFPLKSVQDIPNFFDQNGVVVGGEKMSLNELEKETLFKLFPDARLHFVLVCGALGCPPLTDFAYQPEQLETQLEQQTRLALNDAYFVRLDEAKQQVGLSQIFRWYQSDFGKNQAGALSYIQAYREQKIPEGYGVNYYDYDWTLNDRPRPNLSVGVEKSSVENPTEGGPAPIAANSIRYVVSSTIPKGSFENKIFNNLYTQVTRNDNGDLSQRANFFTTFVTSLYGVSDLFNAGVEIRYRRVSNTALPSSITEVFRGGEPTAYRSGIASIGPKIRWAPVPKWGNFSVQSALWFPVGNDLEGGETGITYFDWDGPTFWTQFFNDFTLGNRFSLFTEIDLFWEDIGNSENGAFNRVSTPVTLIGSFFPNPKTTLYALSGYSPRWAPSAGFDYFAQAGLGAKYQFTRQFELEALYTYFTDQNLQNNNGRASTLNFGIRINL